MHDLARLPERLRKVEALWKGATTPGEARAAKEARQRLLDRLERLQRDRPEPPPPEPEDEYAYEPEIDFRFSMPDPWARKLFLAVLESHGVDTFRYPRQKRSTVRASMSRRVLDEDVWPEFRARWSSLERHLARATRFAVEEVERAG